MTYSYIKIKIGVMGSKGRVGVLHSWIEAIIDCDRFGLHHICLDGDLLCLEFLFSLFDTALQVIYF